MLTVQRTKSDLLQSAEKIMAVQRYACRCESQCSDLQHCGDGESKQTRAKRLHPVPFREFAGYGNSDSPGTSSADAALGKTHPGKLCVTKQNEALDFNVGCLLSLWQRIFSERLLRIHYLIF